MDLNKLANKLTQSLSKGLIILGKGLHSVGTSIGESKFGGQ